MKFVLATGLGVVAYAAVAKDLVSNLPGFGAPINKVSVALCYPLHAQSPAPRLWRCRLPL